MSKLKQSLGRGLDALINQNNVNSTAGFNYDETVEHNEINDFSKIPVQNILPNPYQPRINFDISALDELKKSILTNGLIQPITVRKYGTNNKYQLISGERRLRAIKEIGFKEIPAYIIEVETEEAMIALALIENIQRETLNPIEIGLAYKRLIEDCHLTQEQIAEKVGKDRSTIANSVRLLKLPLEIQASLINNEITIGHARAIINVPSENIQLEILKKIKDESLSVRSVEMLVKRILTKSNSKHKSEFNSNKTDNKNLTSFEDKIRAIFGTKVICKQKQNGAGEIILEYYSQNEFERLLELFEIIEKNNS